MSKSRTKLYVGVGIAAAILVGAFLLMRGRQEEPDPKLEEFARCLASKRVTMYGAEWCPHCKNEKRAFGSAFKFVPYVECPAEPARCLKENIQGYPTWIFPDGRKLEGEQGLARLSKESGCPLDLEEGG